MGAICGHCNGDMLAVDGCKILAVRVGGVDYTPIKVGGEGDFFEGDNHDVRCGDCGAKYGHYHHPGCDCERCPVCGGQMIGCCCDIK